MENISLLYIGYSMNMTILLNWPTNSNQSSKLESHFYMNWQANPQNSYKNEGTQNRLYNLEKEEQNCMTHISGFQSYYKSTVIRLWYFCKDRQIVEWNKLRIRK